MSRKLEESSRKQRADRDWEYWGRGEPVLVRPSGFPACKQPYWLVLLGLISLLTAGGCIPVGWLPDSSGFVYTGRRDFDRLIHYDLATGKRRVLVEKLPGGAPTVAISPDGKRIAVACLRRSKDRDKPETMQVLLYDLQGKLIHSSAELRWGTSRRADKDEHLNTGVFWAARAGVLLVQDYEEPGRTGIYDLEKNTLRQVLDGAPCVYGGTPIRPDGKGFLLVGDLPPAVPEAEVFLVDWQGNKQRIPLKWEIKDPNMHPDLPLGLLVFPWKGTSGWRGPVARVTYGTLRLRIDTEKRTGLIDERRREDATVGGKEVLQHYTFPRGGIQLRVLLAGRTRLADLTTEDEVHLQLEMVRPGQKQPRLLQKIRNGSYCFSPSPDGKWVAIRSGSDTSRTDELLLVSATGQVRKVPGKEN